MNHVDDGRFPWEPNFAGGRVAVRLRRHARSSLELLRRTSYWRYEALRPVPSHPKPTAPELQPGDVHRQPRRGVRRSSGCSTASTRMPRRSSSGRWRN